jgi:hypothetical protein
MLEGPPMQGILSWSSGIRRYYSQCNGAFWGALAAFLAGVAFMGLAVLAALGLPPLAIFWRVGTPFFSGNVCPMV